MSREIGPTNRKRLREHSKHHSPTHMRIMRRRIRKGDSFATAHRKAIRVTR